MAVTPSPVQTIKDLAADTLYDFALELPGDRFEDGGGTPETVLVKVTSPELVALLEQAITAAMTAELRRLADEQASRAPGVPDDSNGVSVARLRARADELDGAAR